MSKSLEIRVGQEFGKWTVTGEFKRAKLGDGSAANYVIYYPCRCECGTIRYVRAFKLLSNSRSCGCEKRRLVSERQLTHGDAANRLRPRRKLYGVWSGMHQRTTNPNHRNYRHYGGKGVDVCPEWAESYTAFRDWSLSNGYAAGLQIDRVDGAKGYSPDNCRWVTRAVNQRNKVTNRIVEAFGESKCLEDWALDPRCSVAPCTILRRIESIGWNAERAITEPRSSRKSSPRYAGSRGYSSRKA